MTTEKRRYVLELDEDHIKALLPALDMAARLHLGQLRMIGDYLAWHVKCPNDRVGPYNDEVAAALTYLKQIFFGDGRLNAGFGIHNPEVSDTARIILGVHDVMRHRLSWDEAGNPETRSINMIGVYYDEPRSTCDKELPTIKKLP